MLWFVGMCTGDTIKLINPKYFSWDELRGQKTMGSLYMVDGMSVIKKTEQICANLTKDTCQFLRDQISYGFYGIPYAPSRPDSSIEDFHSDRRDIIKYLTNRFQYKHYLEIGCEYDMAFGVLKEMYEYAVGVDPAQGGTHRMTSDEFFRQSNLTFDIIFIDGLHTGEQVFYYLYPISNRNMRC
jgi:hypothetical protein